MFVKFTIELYMLVELHIGDNIFYCFTTLTAHINYFTRRAIKGRLFILKAYLGIRYSIIIKAYLKSIE